MCRYAFYACHGSARQGDDLARLFSAAFGTMPMEEVQKYAAQAERATNYALALNYHLILAARGDLQAQESYSRVYPLLFVKSPWPAMDLHSMHKNGLVVCQGQGTYVGVPKWLAGASAVVSDEYAPAK